VGNTVELIINRARHCKYFQAILKKKAKKVAEWIAWTLISIQYHLVVKVHFGIKLRKMAHGKNTAPSKRISGKEYTKMITSRR
jgi:hypothetical protein